MRSAARACSFSLTVALGLAAAPHAARARVVEKIAAVVGDEVILMSEVEEKAAPLLREVAAIPDQQQRLARAAAVRREVLESLVDEQLLLQEGAELRLSVSSEEVDKSIEEIKRQNGIDDEQLQGALRGQGMTMAAYRQDLKRQILRYRVINIAVGSKVSVTDEEVKSYYDRHMRSGTDEQVRASHIFITIPEGADAATVEGKRAAAEKLLRRARAGEDFAKLARENSEDAATRAEGGDLGTFGRDMLPKAIEELVFSMKVGEVRGPVRADRGFHVIKLLDRKIKPARPFDEVKEDLHIKLRQKELERQTKIYLGELRKKTLVDVRI